MKAVATTSALVIVAFAGSALAQPCTPSPLFPGGDFDGPVRAMVTFDSGAGGASLYAAGTFSRAGNTPAGGVIRWTGTEWAPVGGTFDGDVNALCVHDDGTGPKIFAGGNFQSVGGTAATLIAKWNGTSWAAAGPPIFGIAVHALASYPDQSGAYLLYVGGDKLRFSPINLQTSGLLTLRSTNTWSLIPATGIDTMTVYALADFQQPNLGRALFAGGNGRTPFDPYILRYDTQWRPLMANGSDVNGSVHSFTVHNDGSGSALYVGGEFSVANNSIPVPRIARWSGTAWSAVGTGITGLSVRALASIDPDGPLAPLPRALYAGGDFTAAGSVPATNLAKWNGQSWSAAGDTNDTVLALGNRRIGQDYAMFVGGRFSAAGGIPASHTIAFTPAGAQSLHNPASGNAPSDRVRAAAWFDDDGPGPNPSRLFVGGDFRSIGNQSANFSATWDGAAWSAIPGVTVPIYALKVFDDGAGPALYAASCRDLPSGGTPNGQLYRLVNGQWVAQGAPLNGTLLSLEVYTQPGQSPALFGGGNFRLGVNAGTARWDGASWQMLDGFLDGNVSALAVFDDGSGPALFAGGRIGGSPQSVSKWSGTTWTPVGSGLQQGSVVFSLAVFDDGTGPRLHAAGESLMISGPDLVRVARLENGVWTPLSNGPNNLVSQLTVYDDGSGPALIAGGSFTACGTTQTRHLARWNGAAWSAFASALPAAGSTISNLTAIDPDGAGPAPSSLYIGGSFLSIDGVSSPNFAQLNNCSSCYPNCDRSVIPPVLNVSDFTCFLTRYAAADPYANCDGSTIPPVLNVGDFTCFANRFAAGCP